MSRRSNKSKEKRRIRREQKRNNVVAIVVLVILALFVIVSVYPMFLAYLLFGGIALPVILYVVSVMASIPTPTYDIYRNDPFMKRQRKLAKDMARVKNPKKLEAIRNGTCDISKNYWGGSIRK